MQTFSDRSIRRKRTQNETHSRTVCDLMEFIHWINRNSKNMFIVWGFRCFCTASKTKWEKRTIKTTKHNRFSDNIEWEKMVNNRKSHNDKQRNDATNDIRHGRDDSRVETEKHVEWLENTLRFIGNSIFFFFLFRFLPNWFSHSR